jgi:hypothetical protein
MRTWCSNEIKIIRSSLLTLMSIYEWYESRLATCVALSRASIIGLGSHDQINKTFKFCSIFSPEHQQTSRQRLNCTIDISCFPYGENERMARPSSRDDSPFGGPAEEDSAIISVRTWQFYVLTVSLTGDRLEVLRRSGGRLRQQQPT